MSFLDKAKERAAEAAEKAKASELGEKAKSAADALDEKTGGKVTEARHKASDLADKAKEKLPTDKLPGQAGKAEEESDEENDEEHGNQA